jgi:dipeptidyl aminopeptidase/acylaminoacyl peptidase
LAHLLAACGDDAPPAAAPSPTASAPSAAEAAPPLLARELLFGNPERMAGAISPDGRWLGYVAPRDGVLNVYVASADAPESARPVTNDRQRGIRNFTFAYTGNHVLYSQDVGGDENFQVFAVELTTGAERTLSPQGARAWVAETSADFPDEVVIAVNDRDPAYHDLMRVNLRTGDSVRLIENTEFAAIYVDDDFALRYASKQTEAGGQEYFRRDGDGWSRWLDVPPEDGLTTWVAGLTTDGATLYLLDSRERDTSALFAIDVDSGDRVLVHEDARADVSRTLAHPVTGVVQAASVNYLRDEWAVLDPDLAPDFDRLRMLGPGEINVVSRTLADDRWVVVLSRSNATPKYYLYDRNAGAAQLWFDTRPALANVPLAVMHPVEVPSRDGLTLVSYYTLPMESDADDDGRPEAPLPMTLLVHGGPWGRDAYGLNNLHQWLANRGYAVLAVNFRASTGFGKAFVNAGDMEWGGKMHDDLIDAVAWAVNAGIAQHGEVAIMGGSYGGYATLVGLTMTPTEFSCGVDIVGPSNLVTLLSTIPPYWEPIKNLFRARLGDVTTAEGRAFLLERSPLTYADRIQRPLLIGQGANDPRVKQTESDQIVSAMQERSIPVTYVLYPDEGHGFVRPENRLSFYAAAEEFLGACLGGRVEPPGDDLQGASITVPAGAELLPSLNAALGSMPSAAP